MKVIQIKAPNESIDTDQFKSIFLAGTIDNGNSIDWQAATFNKIEGIVKNKQYNCIVYNPRRENWGELSEQKLNEQINWELNHLKRADYIIFNFEDDSKSPITFLELGLCLATKSKQCFVRVTPKFYRYENVIVTCKKFGCDNIFENMNLLLSHML